MKIVNNFVKRINDKLNKRGTSFFFNKTIKKKKTSFIILQEYKYTGWS